MNVDSDGEDRTITGRLFQVLGPATANTRLPRTVRVLGRVRFQWERLGTEFPKFFGRGNAVPTIIFPDKLKKRGICISKLKGD